MPTIEQLIAKYVELRDRKAEMAERQKQENAPINDAMDKIENYLMAKMNEIGVEQFKSESGTAFKANATSVQMQDALEFKKFVFSPVINQLTNYLRAAGYDLRDVDASVFLNIICEQVRWDMVDFRAGKKGIQEYIANENTPVPGVAVNTVATINIRRS